MGDSIRIEEDEAPDPLRARTLAESARFGKEDPREEEEPAGAVVDVIYRFDVEDKITGRKGTFTSTIPDVATRCEMGRYKARLAGGMPWVSLPPEDAILMDAMAWCTFCANRDAPKWFEDLHGARMPHVILAVGEVARSHYDRWFRYVAKMGSGTTYRELVEITPSVGGAVRAA